MSWQGKTRRQVEFELLEAVQFARAEYDELTAKYLAAQREAGDIGTGTTDGNFAQARSLEIHHALKLAQDRYAVALKRFHRVVVDRKSPEGSTTQGCG